MLCVRGVPALGCGDPAVAQAEGWCHALMRREVVRVRRPAMQGIFVHPLDMACGDPLEIYTEGNSVILRKHESSCVFCGSNKKVTLYKDKCICDNCRRELAL